MAEAPAAAFADVEERLLDAPRLEMDYAISAEGAFQAELQGTLVLADDTVRLDGGGTFGDEPVTLQLATEGDSLRGRWNGGMFVLPTPDRLDQALVVGLMRMGLLHNLARLTAGAPPDHAEGGVRDWVRVDSLRTDPAAADSMAASEEHLTFDIVVSGEPSGTATLWLDPATRLPLERSQVVRFPTGRMAVTERYTFRQPETL